MKITHPGSSIPDNTQRPRVLCLAIALALLGTQAAQADADADAAITLPRINVVVAPQDAPSPTIPGAVSLITAEELDRMQPRSVDEALRRVPGIFAKVEEESSVVSNIGVRGLSAGDYKTLVLEDGVPIQPGLFVGNSRYYGPRVHRMEGVEVLRGAASLRYGPNTIGGVINFLTRMPDDGVVVGLRAGSWNTVQGTLEMGGSSPSGDSRIGLIATTINSDGFLDRGFGMRDVMFRAGSALTGDQSVSVKFVQYRNTANISYRGLFPDAYSAGARFNPAPDDFFLTERSSFDINHAWDLGPNASLNTLVYWSNMYRDYWRFALVGGAPTTTNAQGFTIWNYGNNINGNNREFTRVGLDSRLTLQHSSLGIGNEAEIGVRLMQEEMKDQTVLAVRGRPRTPDPGRGGISQDRLDSGDSLALFAQNRFDIDSRLSLTTGLRIESYEQERKDRRSSAPAQRYTNTEFMPGIGATFMATPSMQLYGSVYRAFAPPLVGSVLGSGDTPTEAEKSLNIELGLRGGEGRYSYELTLFQMDFSNQVDPGVSGIRAPNEGSALHRGMEAGFGYQLAEGWQLDANLTWVPTAEFREDRPGTALKGNRLPDSPELMANIALSWVSGPLQAALLVNHTGEFFGDAMNRREFTTTNSGGIWGGLAPGRTTADLTARYAFNSQLELFGSVKNLTDKRYIAGFRQGIYVGPERAFDLGFRYGF